jgi:hypothetical protein
MVFSTLGYWTRRERWSLLFLVAAGWLSLGYARVYGRVAEAGYAATAHVGSINGPEDFGAYLASDERTLLQAMSLQITGDAAGAERLYRSVPQFAQAWNNIGVLRAKAGDVDGSRAAFAQALALDPDLGEAVFNARGQATTEATQSFARYAEPGTPMAAIPSREQLLRASLGRWWTFRYAAVLLGPIEPLLELGAIIQDPKSTLSLRFGSTSIQAVGAAIVVGVGLVWLVLLQVSMVLIGRQDATVPPGRGTAVVEALVPGLSGAWRGAGTAILLVWSGAILTAVLQVTGSTPYLLLRWSQPGMSRVFGYPGGFADLNPPLALSIGIAVVLWMANFLLIRSRRAT